MTSLKFDEHGYAVDESGLRFTLCYCGWCGCSIAIDSDLRNARDETGVCCNDPECRELEREAIREVPRPYTPRY